MSVQEEICEKWWNKWIDVAFPLLAPRKKWNQEHRSVQEGDVVLLRYDSKVSKARYRLARVVQAHPDKCGVVRTVTIKLRPRHIREKVLPYKAKQMTEFPVGVQRLVVIVPVEEQLGCEQQERNDENVDQGPREDDFGTTSTECRTPTPRRSRRVRGEPPEPFIAAVGHNHLPRPWSDVSTIPAAAFSLHSRALPLLVPAWLPEVFNNESESTQSVMPYEG